ncbi:hypothetical protein [Arundinibacter roseus]|uniref:DUF4174 domain-containing protein n=1 Tax=Arundinibacter roseus TaxID=2070510 RepID=A0A4R4KFW1_9BACT|nr:hypothetical protein [Arundinibacter roseus]TDB66897.1 hypothetical protein EZE20_07165 [Arundinibacter roseus]
MKKQPIFLIPTLLSLLTIFMSTYSFGQVATLPEFLKEKQVWDEKLIVVYTPDDQPLLSKEQLNVLHPYTQVLRKEKIVLVQLPNKLSKANKLFLQQKFRYQPDRINVWVFDEKGNMRMCSTKPIQAEQVLKVLNIETRPEAVVKAKFFLE